MSSNRKVLMLPGDGIGPEVMKETKKVIDWFDKRLEVGFDLEEGLVGGAYGKSTVFRWCFIWCRWWTRL